MAMKKLIDIITNMKPAEYSDRAHGYWANSVLA
jgi:hypothetical protein